MGAGWGAGVRRKWEWLGRARLGFVWHYNSPCVATIIDLECLLCGWLEAQGDTAVRIARRYKNLRESRAYIVFGRHTKLAEPALLRLAPAGQETRPAGTKYSHPSSPQVGPGCVACHEMHLHAEQNSFDKHSSTAEIVPRHRSQGPGPAFGWLTVVRSRRS
jgi:hypothetical protein